MSKEITTGLIFKRIPEIMAEMDSIGKNKKNQQQGFMYRGIEGVYQELQKRLAKAKVFTTPEVLEQRREERQTKTGGTLTYTILKICYKFYAEDGSCFEATVIGEGMDSGDKGSNKAMSIAHKYALIQVFCIPTEDAVDPDAESHDVLPGDNKPEATKPVKNVLPSLQAKIAKDPGEYVINFGKRKGQKINKVPVEELEKYKDWLIDSSKKDGKPLSANAAEFIANFDAFVGEAVDVEFNNQQLGSDIPF